MKLPKRVKLWNAPQYPPLQYTSSELFRFLLAPNCLPNTKKKEENNVAKEPPEKREESSGHFVNIFHVYFSGESRKERSRMATEFFHTQHIFSCTSMYVTICILMVIYILKNSEHFQPATLLLALVFPLGFYSFIILA